MNDAAHLVKRVGAIAILGGQSDLWHNHDAEVLLELVLVPVSRAEVDFEVGARHHHFLVRLDELRREVALQSEPVRRQVDY